MASSFIFGLGLAFMSDMPSRMKAREPAGTAITEYTDDEVSQAEWSVAPVDFENSDPGRGRSYFDYVFSKLNGEKREYDIPYPFEKVLGRLSEYLGHSSPAGLGVVLFPMGRSLQRNAALGDGHQFDQELFFKFPRVVVGVTQEPKIPFALNLKGRLYIGFHEKSKVLEVISYNDNEGRYEYQVVRDYEQGHQPKVFYANRQLCLSCHQNQTPIFSKGPWEETNAHPFIFNKLSSQIKSDSYHGAPLKIDLGVPYALDTLIGKANYYHAFQKMWLTLCESLECKQKTIKGVLSYLLNGQEGIALSPDDVFLKKFEEHFRSRFPKGLKIPDASVPNRNPLRDRQKSQAEIEKSLQKMDTDLKDNLQDLITRSAVSGHFEPLLIRPPIELWMDSGRDQRNTNKMLVGFAEFFTLQDVQQLDNWLARSANEKKSKNFEVSCDVEKFPNGDNYDLQVSCPFNDSTPLALESLYVSVSGGTAQGQLESLFFYPEDMDCQRGATQSLGNRVQSLACPAVLKAQARGTMKGDQLQIGLYQAGKGIRTRLIDGRLLSQLQLDLRSKKLKIRIFDDVSQIDRIVESLKIPHTPFSRKFVLRALAAGFGENWDDPDVQGKMETLEKNLEGDVTSEKEIFATYKNPLDAYTHSCAMCHYNFEGVPPAFLGLKQKSISLVEKCQRIEVCAPRMLYRLKMRNCPADQIARMQKNPMPLPNFFRATSIDPTHWQKQVAPELTKFATQLIDPNRLVQTLTQQGVAAQVAQKTVQELVDKDCPQIDYKIYENFPLCDFSRLPEPATCERLMAPFQGR